MTTQDTPGARGNAMPAVGSNYPYGYAGLVKGWVGSRRVTLDSCGHSHKTPGTALACAYKMVQARRAQEGGAQ